MAGYDKSDLFGVNIESPADGDIVSSRDGEIKCGKLFIPVIVGIEAAAQANSIKVNGVPAVKAPTADVPPASGTHAAGRITQAAQICLSPGENLLTLTSGDGRLIKQIRIFWFEQLVGRYRFSVDDNIHVFKDLTEKRGKYASVFDNPYLAIFKDAHDRFGTKVHLNVYYKNDGFDLTQMTDKYRNEWRENSNWLAMTFHALKDKPDMIYKDVGYEEIKSHYEMVTEQIIRFAGEEVLSPFTTIHWGEVTKEGCLALRDSGIKGLAGYFQVNRKGETSVSYYLDKKQTEHLSGRDAWVDNDTGLIFVKNDIVINITKMDEIMPHLEKVKKDPRQSGFMELMIHEQYYHREYFAYQPDYREKVLAAIRWTDSNGYRPALLKDIFS